MIPQINDTEIGHFCDLVAKKDWPGSAAYLKTLFASYGVSEVLETVHVEFFRRGLSWLQFTHEVTIALLSK